jgi:signal peptidase I
MPESPSPYAPPASPGRDRAGPAPHWTEGSPLPNASPFVAVVLSLICPGLGHAYARRWLRALAWVSLIFVASLVVAVSLHAGRRSAGIVFFVLVFDQVFVRLGTTIDVAVLLRHHKGPRAPFAQLIVAWVVVGGIFVANSLGLRMFVVEAFKIPSGSMIPTLLVGDHVFIDKTQAPARGDVIVFPFPENPKQDFIKRVVGLPGDRVEFHDGHPVVNGIAVPSCLLGVASYEEPDGDVTTHSGKVYLERLGDRSYLALYDDASGGVQEKQGPYVVKSGELFVVGDNRNNSHDSRMWFGGEGGGVPITTVVGVPFAVWLSSDDQRVDWSRAGLTLDEPHLSRSMASLAPALQECLANQAR